MKSLLIITSFILSLNMSVNTNTDFNRNLFLKRITVDNSLDDNFYKKNINSFPDQKIVSLMYSYWLLKQDRTEESQIVFDSIDYNSISNDDITYYHMIETLFYLNNHSKGKYKFNFSKSIDSDFKKENKWLRLELFYYYLDSDEEYKAWGYIEESLNIDPSFYDGILAKYYELDELENCNEILNSLSEIPNSFKDYFYYYWLGLSSFNCGDYNKSLIYLHNSVSLFPNSKAYYVLGSLFHYKDIDFLKSKEYYLKGIELDNDENCIHGYAWLSYDQGDYKQADTMFMRLLNIDTKPEYYDSYIRYNLLINNLQKTKEIIDEKYERVGTDYVSEGYKIILKKLENKDLNLESMFLNYSRKYNVYEQKWLEEEIETIIFGSE